ncbi:MAG: FAD-dependent oxidoreductase [Actinomycetota bacterium]|nr:FAD-dependent oxidoreductase [Actinomycetota bacterium]MDP9486072.1 FAD-dependent oxidoreductase [Actinomycetota bacterium]
MPSLRGPDIGLAARRVLESFPVEGADELEVEIAGDVVRLRGRLARWEDVVEVGHALAKESGLSNLVCEVRADDEQKTTPPPMPEIPVGALPARAEAVVVGGGIVGMAVARGLVRSGLDVLVLEAGGAIGGASTSWNNGMIHSGLDPTPGTLKARLNVRGNLLWPALAAELDIPILRTGSLLVAFDEDGVGELERFLGRARANGVPGAEIVSGLRALELEPGLNPKVVAALWTPSAAYIDAVEAARAMAEDIREHGGKIVLRAPVTGVEVQAGRVVGVSIQTAQVETDLVVNAAGLNADRVAALAGCQRYSIHPRRGTLLLFDAEAGAPFRRAVGLPPLPYTKGGGLTPRPGGEMVGGPSAAEQADRHRADPAAWEVEEILEKGSSLLPSFPLEAVREVGSGLRAATYSEDFVIGSAPGVDGFFDVAGMQSPGVASIPAVVELVLDRLRSDGMLARTDAPFTTRAERRSQRRNTEEHGGGDHA